jgi:hypothetical protein
MKEPVAYLAVKQDVYILSSEDRRFALSQKGEGLVPRAFNSR